MGHCYDFLPEMSTIFRKSSYYSRVFIPKDIQCLVGRAEILRSLCTKSHKDAKLRSAKWEGHLAQIFEYLRKHRKTMQPEQLRPYFQQYFQAKLGEWEHLLYQQDYPLANVSPSPSEDENKQSWQAGLVSVLEKDMGQSASALQQNVFTDIEPRVEEFLLQYQLPITKGTSLYQILCREFAKTEQAITKELIKRIQGDYSTDYSSSGLSPLYSQQPLTNTKRFSEALEEYFTHYADRLERTKQEKKVIFARFRDTIGGNLHLPMITKSHGKQFRDLYCKLPKRIPNKLQSLPMPDIVKESASQSCQRVTRKTVNQALEDLRHFFRWAIDHDLYPGKNPIDGLLFENVPKNSYDFFTNDDLQKIFTSHTFLQQRESKYAERYWLIWILFLTGARREEIAQLALNDVRYDDDEHIWFFQIAPDEERGTTVKNTASKRRIPIHPHLINLGLLDHVQQRRASGDTTLIPLPTRNNKTHKTKGDAIGKWFKKLLEKEDIKGHKTIHSFRHTLITQLTGLDVPQNMVEMLVGHTSKSVHGQTYVHRDAIPLSTLRQHLEKFDCKPLLSKGE